MYYNKKIHIKYFIIQDDYHSEYLIEIFPSVLLCSFVTAFLSNDSHFFLKICLNNILIVCCNQCLIKNHIFYLPVMPLNSLLIWCSSTVPFYYLYKIICKVRLIKVLNYICVLISILIERSNYSEEQQSKNQKRGCKELLVQIRWPRDSAGDST